MTPPLHLVPRETPVYEVDHGSFPLWFSDFLVIGLPIITVSIFTCCIGLCVWNRRKMRRKRGQEVALQALPAKGGDESLPTKS